MEVLEMVDETLSEIVITKSLEATIESGLKTIEKMRRRLGAESNTFIMGAQVDGPGWTREQQVEAITKAYVARFGEPTKVQTSEPEGGTGPGDRIVMRGFSLGDIARTIPQGAKLMGIYMHGVQISGPGWTDAQTKQGVDEAFKVGEQEVRATLARPSGWSEEEWARLLEETEGGFFSKRGYCFLNGTKVHDIGWTPKQSFDAIALVKLRK